MLAHSHSWKAGNSKPIENINKAIQAAEEPAHPRQLIDMLCVADLGFWSSMYVAKYVAAWVGPERVAALEQELGGPWGVTTSLVCADLQQPGQTDTFKPIGGLIAYLTQRLAWDEPSARDIADYYRLAELWGSGVGLQSFWPRSVYSAEVQQKIEQGKLSNNGWWDDWTVGGI